MKAKKIEHNFLAYLKKIYLNEQEVNFIEGLKNGGTPDYLLGYAGKHMHYDRNFVWIDEDIELNKTSREFLFKEWQVDHINKDEFLNCPLGELQYKYNNRKRNPILIISQPICVESLILRTLGKELCHQFLNKDIIKKQRTELKNSLAGVFGKKNQDQSEYYSNNLLKDQLESKRLEIRELDFLISMLIKPTKPSK